MTDSPRASLLRACTIFCAMFYAFALWSTRQDAFGDFRILHFGSKLVREGRTAEAYDAEAFRQASIRDPSVPDITGELQDFLSTPAFALAMRPFTYLSSDVALIVWSVLGVAALFAGVQMLRLPWWTSMIGLVLPMSLSNVFLAQTGFFAFAWAAAIHRLCVDGRLRAAGMVAGFAVLKPTLLLGVALWWLLDWRKWHRALLPAAGVGSLVVLPTFASGTDQWRGFLDALEARDALGLEVVANQPTIAEVVNRAFGTGVGSHPLALAIYLALGAVAMWAALRRWPDRVDLLSGAAIIVSVLVSPHLLIYDAPLLIIPFAVAVHARASTSELDRLVGAVVISGLLTILPIEPFPSINDRVILATFGVAAAGAVWVSAVSQDRRLDATAPIVDATADFEDDGALPEAA